MCVRYELISERSGGQIFCPSAASAHGLLIQRGPRLTAVRRTARKAGKNRRRPCAADATRVESESLLFLGRVTFMNQGRLESQIHESGRAGESWLFTGFMNLSVASVTRPNSAPSRTHTPGTSPTQPVRRSGALAEGAPRLPQIGKPYPAHPHRPSDANSHLWRHM